MKILVDAVLFQLRPANTDDMRLCTRVLTELAVLAAARDIGFTVLDRGDLPDLGRVETCQFPSYKAENSVADGEMLERMGHWVGADAFVSTALTMMPSIPNVQLLFGEGGEALLPGRAGASEEAECEIALAFSSAVVFASPAVKEAFRFRFPRHRLWGRRTNDGIASDGVQTLWMAEAAVDAVVRATADVEDAERQRKFLALRRMQAAFELSSPSTSH